MGKSQREEQKIRNKNDLVWRQHAEKFCKHNMKETAFFLLYVIRYACHMQ